MQELNTFRLTCAQEPDHLRVYQRQFLKIQHNFGFAGGDLCLQFRKVLASNSTNQLYSRVVRAGDLLDLQSHASARLQCTRRPKVVEQKAIASDRVAVFSEIAQFSARNRVVP